MSLTANPAADGSGAKALEIVDLEKRYPNGVEALRGVSITIEPGDFYGLLGPNGAGKSTLIHCTTGLAQPTGGARPVVQWISVDLPAPFGPSRP